MEQILCNEYHDGGYGTKRNHDIMGRRLSDALSLTLRNLANFQILSEESNGRCPRDVYIHVSYWMWLAIIGSISVRDRYIISAWALTLFILTRLGSARAS